MVRRFPSWTTIETALFQQDGAKLVFLLRLSPLLPDRYAMHWCTLLMPHARTRQQQQRQPPPQLYSSVTISKTCSFKYDQQIYKTMNGVVLGVLVAGRSVMNYALALTSVGFSLFAAATAFAMIPYTALYCYVGAASKDIWAVRLIQQ